MATGDGEIREIRTIEDVREVFDDIREALAEVEAQDLSAPGAEMLIEPLGQLHGELQRLYRDMQALVAEADAR
jgi:hypothetical protein